MIIKYRARLPWLIFTIIFGSIAEIIYMCSGYQSRIFAWILLSIIMGGIYFYQSGAFRIYPIKQEVRWILVLISIVTPAYLYHFYSIPWQINTDEIVIMNASKDITARPGVDILGPSYYLGFAALIFYVFGKCATWLGGIDLYHYRLVHAISGILISIAAYGFFRQVVSSRSQAFILSLWLVSNHALFAISRMAMRDNTGLLIELLSLTCLLYGWKAKQNVWLFTGGILGGLSFYTYFPSRVTMIIWLVSVLVYTLIFYKTQDWKESLKDLLVSFFGFFLVASFMFISSMQHVNEAVNYSRQQFLFYAEGRALQQAWVSASTSIQGWMINIKNGLSTFNNYVHDLGYIYPNYGHGFVDPMTGVLLWIGVIVVVGRCVKQKTNFSQILCLVGFFGLYLAFAFLITKAPNYTRLFVILPFVIYFASEGAVFISALLVKLVDILRLSKFSAKIEIIVTFSVLLVVISWNAYIFRDYVRMGRLNEVGSTARYILARKEIINQKWVLVASKKYPYYYWGDEYQWHEWFRFFSGPQQTTQVISPEKLNSLILKKPYTLILSQKAWEFIKPEYANRHPNGILKKITSDGRYLAVEEV